MKNRMIAVGSIGICIVIFTFVAFTALKQDVQGQKSPSEAITRLLKVESSVKELSIIRTNLRDADTPVANIFIEIRNESDKPITHITLISGAGKDVAGTTFGASEGVLIPAHGEYQMPFLLSNVIRGFPIRIGGVMYADESTSGDEKSLERLRRQKEHDRSELRGGN